jgi:hypothetical protein
VRSTGEIIVKAVNPSGAAIATTFNFPGVGAINPNATVVQLTSGNSSDLNSLDQSAKVSPVTNAITGAGTNFTLTLPAYSLSVLRLQASAINSITNLLLQFPSPIYLGQTVTSTIAGQLSGQWIDLKTNGSYGITYSSSDTAVAAVNASGNVSGVGAGAANIIATYAALGLSTTQTVQVINVPTALVHRYSFSESSGTNCADSVGGAAWNGTLPNGGAFAGGQLALSANSQQYVNLPSGILSNYMMVTIDVWATFGTLSSSKGTFLYGFGNISGSSGLNYIFCQPKNGRIAITDSDWNGEQGTGGAGDWSGRTVHVTSVFNPPAGYVALYTNGVLVSQNSAVTKTFASVNDIYSFIGRSLYSGDTYMDVSLDEFRIYNGALNTNQIAATQALGPDQLLVTNSPSLSTAIAGGSLTLSWPLASAGFTVQTRTNLILGAWTPANLVPQIVGGQWRVSLPVAGREQYYRLQQ